MACLHYDCPQAGTAMGNFLDQRCMWVSAAHLCRATPGQASWVRSESMWVSIAMWFCFRPCLRPWIPTLTSLNDKILPTINCFWSVCDIVTYLGHAMKRFTCELTVNFSLCPVRPTESMYPQGYWFLPSTWFGKVAYEVLIRFYFLESLSSLFWSCSWLHLSTPRVGLQKLRCSLAPLFSLHPHCKKLLYHCHKSHPGLVPWYLFVPQCWDNFLSVANVLTFKDMMITALAMCVAHAFYLRRELVFHAAMQNHYRVWHKEMISKCFSLHFHLCVCVWVCMCMHECVCMHVRILMHLFACTLRWLCMHCVCMYVHVHVCVQYVCMCVSMYVCIYVYVCLCMCTCACMCTLWVHVCVVSSRPAWFT
jgi:hypothetical protein